MKATNDMVTVRTMFKTWSVPWPQIEGFVAEIGSELVFWPPLLPFPARRSVLCVRLRNRGDPLAPRAELPTRERQLDLGRRQCCQAE
jgi:hypothetical protein